MAEFWMHTFSIPGQAASTALRAETDGWDRLIFTETHVTSDLRMTTGVPNR
jgi:hypothetical protein